MEDTFNIPENSSSPLISDNTLRFRGADWFEKVKANPVLIAGVGGIGSWLAVLVARLQPSRIYLYDNDKVQYVNLAGQLFAKSDVGRFKVDAVTTHLTQFCDYYQIWAESSIYDRSCPAYPITMCGFDNMEARQITFIHWEKAVASLPKEQMNRHILIDGRLGFEDYQIFCIQGDDDWAKKEYEDKWLFSDKNAEETICTRKQTSFMASMIASMMVNLYVNWLQGIDIPFLTRYNATLNYLKTDY